MQEDLALLVRISRMYYESELTQLQIAEATGLSRPTISRSLDRAKRAGIVEIRIRDPLESTRALASTLVTRFGSAMIVCSVTSSSSNEGGTP